MRRGQVCEDRAGVWGGGRCVRRVKCVGMGRCVGKGR